MSSQFPFSAESTGMTNLSKICSETFYALMSYTLIQTVFVVIKNCNLCHNNNGSSIMVLENLSRNMCINKIENCCSLRVGSRRHGIDPKLIQSRSAGQELSNEV